MSRSITVVLLRHAATAWSAKRRVHADDAPLSPEGEAQTARWRLPADLLRLQAAGQLGWATSPLRRAVETGRRLGATAPLVDPRLAELDYGDWKGLRFEEVDALTRDTGWEEPPETGTRIKRPSPIRICPWALGQARYRIQRPSGLSRGSLFSSCPVTIAWASPAWTPCRKMSRWPLRSE